MRECVCVCVCVCVEYLPGVLLSSDCRCGQEDRVLSVSDTVSASPHRHRHEVPAKS